MDFKDNPAKIPELGFTHAGRFHADEVLSTALLRILRPDIRIYRGFQLPKGFSGIVYDIGDGPFDHHQKNSPKRANGVPYAAFGLLWREYGTFILSQEEADRFDEKFIQPIDLDDNSGTGHLLSNLLGSFNPSWDSDADSDERFFEAVEVAEKLLGHKLESIAAIERGKLLVEENLKNMKDTVVVLKEYVPWKPVLIPSPAEFVVFPSVRGGFSVQCIPKDFNGKTGHKVPLPSDWYGLPTEELARVSGIHDMQFCHASGFMATVGSLEGAMQITQTAKKEFEKRKAENAARKAAEQAQKEDKLKQSQGDTPS